MNWPHIIKSARARGYCTRKEIADAGDWRTCPTAKLDVPRREESVSPTQREYEPLDQRIANLGREFYGAVSANDFTVAEMVLKAIERRRVAV